jgi:hypothetical protein
MQYVKLRSFDNYIPAHIALGKLENQSISCYLVDENTVTIDPFLSYAIGGIKLMVASSQAERALSILNDLGPSEIEQTS